MYFNVEKFPEYGLLSGRKLADNRAGERVSVDSRKKNPADFALWKVNLVCLVLLLSAACIASNDEILYIKRMDKFVS